ncbi:hypothetical protein QTP88_009280 [Uroleucon formosanum]
MKDPKIFTQFFFMKSACIAALKCIGFFRYINTVLLSIIKLNIFKYYLLLLVLTTFKFLILFIDIMTLFNYSVTKRSTLVDNILIRYSVCEIFKYPLLNKFVLSTYLITNCRKKYYETQKASLIITILLLLRTKLYWKNITIKCQTGYCKLYYRDLMTSTVCSNIGLCQIYISYLVYLISELKIKPVIKLRFQI